MYLLGTECSLKFICGNLIPMVMLFVGDLVEKVRELAPSLSALQDHKENLTLCRQGEHSHPADNLVWRPSLQHLRSRLCLQVLQSMVFC